MAIHVALAVAVQVHPPPAFTANEPDAPPDGTFWPAGLIEIAEDAFDLCRYYNVLVEAPGARACAYKEMGKCPAPCDGSISMEQYRGMVEWSAQGMVDPATLVRDHTRRMQQAFGHCEIFARCSL